MNNDSRKVLGNSLGGFLALIILPLGLYNDWTSGTMFWLLMLMLASFFYGGMDDQIFTK